MTTSALLNLLLTLVIIGVIFYVIWWGLQRIALPEPFGKVAIVIFVIALVVVLYNFLWPALRL